LSKYLTICKTATGHFIDLSKFAACGQSTYNDPTGTITSQNYPNYYQNYQTCNYYINAPSLSTINFTFNGLGLEQTSTCYYDWIEVGSTLSTQIFYVAP